MERTNKNKWKNLFKKKKIAPSVIRTYKNFLKLRLILGHEHTDQPMEWNGKSRNKPIIYGNKSYVSWGKMDSFTSWTDIIGQIEKLDSILIPCTINFPINQKFKWKE